MRSLSLTLLVAAVVGLCASAEEPAQTIKPVLVWSGTDSKCAAVDFDRCHSQSEWDAVWKRHVGADPDDNSISAPQIDFNAYMVAVIFHGKNGLNHGIRVPEVIEEGKAIRVRFRPMWYQIAWLPRTQEDNRKLDTQSFAFIVLPTSKKTVIFEENAQSLIDGPPKWEGRAQIVMLGD